MKLIYKFAYLPTGLFSRCQTRISQYSTEASRMWKRGALFVKNQHVALLKHAKDNELVLTVFGRRPENVLYLVNDVGFSVFCNTF